MIICNLCKHMKIIKATESIFSPTPDDYESGEFKNRYINIFICTKNFFEPVANIKEYPYTSVGIENCNDYEEKEEL